MYFYTVSQTSCYYRQTSVESQKYGKSGTSTPTREEATLNRYNLQLSSQLLQQQSKNSSNQTTPTTHSHSVVSSQHRKYTLYYTRSLFVCFTMYIRITVEEIFAGFIQELDFAYDQMLVLAHLEGYWSVWLSFCTFTCLTFATYGTV